MSWFKQQESCHLRNVYKISGERGSIALNGRISTINLWPATCLSIASFSLVEEFYHTNDIRNETSSFLSSICNIAAMPWNFLYSKRAIESSCTAAFCTWEMWRSKILKRADTTTLYYSNDNTATLSIQFLDIITNEWNRFALKINAFQETIREFNQMATNIAQLISDFINGHFRIMDMTDIDLAGIRIEWLVFLPIGYY